MCVCGRVCVCALQARTCFVIHSHEHEVTELVAVTGDVTDVWNECM